MPRKKKPAGAGGSAPKKGRPEPRYYASLKTVGSYSDGAKTYKKGEKYLMAESEAKKLCATGYFTMRAASEKDAK